MYSPNQVTKQEFALGYMDRIDQEYVSISLTAPTLDGLLRKMRRNRNINCKGCGKKLKDHPIIITETTTKVLTIMPGEEQQEKEEKEDEI